MSFENKTVEPQRSPIDSPCQNVEKGSGDGTHNSVPCWAGLYRLHRMSGYGMHRSVWWLVCFQVFPS